MDSRPETFKKKEFVFYGKPLSPGIARGKAYVLKNVDIQRLLEAKRSADAVSSELAKLELAVTKSKDQISRSIDNARRSQRHQMRSIFEAYLSLGEDVNFLSGIRSEIARYSLSVEYVLAREIARLRDRVGQHSDEFRAKPLITLQDLYYRLLYNVRPISEDRIAVLKKMEPGSILVADRLTPVEVGAIPADRVAGITIEQATKNSHASILSMALQVPVVIELPGIGSVIDQSTDLMIDANRGYVFVNPSEATVRESNKLERRLKLASESIEDRADSSRVRSYDGIELRLLCNASSLSDVQRASRLGIREIGLFRSEIFYLTKSAPPYREDEAACYRGILSVEGMDKVSFRLLDVGGDKLPLYLHMEKESDPQLGCRGIRFLLAHPELMKNQIRSILAAHGPGKLPLILPFISVTEDLSSAKAVISEVLSEMHFPGDSVELGIMVEVPSVALALDQFLKEVDFVNLGTNDLIQYLFAANRDQHELRTYCRFTHPAFLRMLSDIVVACEKHGKPLTACGEMASHPLGCCLLAALGVRRLSVPPGSIPRVRQAISKIKLSELRDKVPGLLSFRSANEVEQQLPLPVL